MHSLCTHYALTKHSLCTRYRDIKPANLFLSKGGAYKIGDFGLSRILKDKDGLDIAATYTANVGSPAYMAPELLATDCKDAQYASGIDMYRWHVNRLIH
jgi:serine/threonine protein kinase